MSPRFWRRSLVKSELIKPTHLTRKAVVYIRQSTPHQVVSNQESLRLQYALRERAHELGWHEADIDVIDADLGLSGASAAGRSGFKELVGRVSLSFVLGSSPPARRRSGRAPAAAVRADADRRQSPKRCAWFGSVTHPETRLQLPHRMAERRRRDVKLRSGSSKAPLIGNSDESGQIGQVATIHC
jgi:hypothetical protein